MQEHEEMGGSSPINAAAQEAFNALQQELNLGDEKRAEPQYIEVPRGYKQIPSMAGNTLADQNTYERQGLDPDVIASIDIVSGKTPMGLIDGAPIQNPPSQQPVQTPGDVDMDSFQKSVIRSKEAKYKKKVTCFTPHLDVFDITNIQQKNEFETILRRIGDPNDKCEMGSPYKIENVVDPSAGRGYRTIVILDWFEYEEAIQDKTDQLPDLSITNTEELLKSRQQNA